ncbi:MAG: hypothetical protein M1830_003663 [Pleopsidium flavum]|nr:MAG: hypothetical protein M1830_003663 [Pleopsidium flavum]
MSSDTGDLAPQDFDESISAIQDDELEDYLGTQLEESHQEHEDIDLNYDPNVVIAEAIPVAQKEMKNTRHKSTYRASYVDADTEETLLVSLPSMYTTSPDDGLSDNLLSSSVAEKIYSTQTSQGPSPTQRSQTATPRHESAAASPALVIDVDELKAGITSRIFDQQDSSHPISDDETNVTAVQGKDSPKIKREEQNDDVVFLISNSLEEPITISDDEDLLESNNPDLDVNALQKSSKDQSAIRNGTGGIDMGNSVLRTRTKKQKPTKEQMQMMKRAQQLLAQQAGRKSTTGGAGMMFRGTANGHDAAVISDIDDHAWMNEELDDDSDDSVIIAKLKKKIIGKIKKNQHVLEEEVKLINAEKKKAIRDRRRRNNATYDDDDNINGLFFPDGGNEHKKRKIARDASQQYYDNRDPAEYDLDFDETTATSLRRQGKRIAQNGAASINEAGRFSDEQPPVEGERATRNLLMAMAIDTREDPKKKARKKRTALPKTAKEAHEKNRNKATPSKVMKTPKTNSKAKATKGGKGSKTAPASKATKEPSKPAEKKAVPKRAAGGYGTSGDSSELLMNLLHNDAIAVRVAQGDLGDAPVIGEKKSKARMLKELIASVPAEHSRHVTNDKKDLLQASKNFGYGKVKAEEGKWGLKGMRSPLYHHQLLGADFMVGRECGTIEPYGGLLADAMGLGKTLQVLATMVGNPPTPDEARLSKITLLVVPSAVIRQWQDEIALHVDHGFFKKIMHYKANKEISMDILKDCDILITSYAEVMNSYPWPNQEELKSLSADNIAQWTNENWKRRGQLHHLDFYRVVLDEAHMIKNYRSRTSVACVTLDARLRWALTGTPILNRLEELYPYFRFLSVDYAEDFQTFKREFCNPHSAECNRRVLSLLSYMMIRRTIQDRIFDRPIVELPKTHPDLKRVDFSKEERALYQILEERFRRDFNSYFAAGTAQKNYRNLMVKLLRLRQCTSHPFLLHQTIKDIFTLEDLRNLEARITKANPDKRPIYDQIGLWVKDASAQREANQNKVRDVNTPNSNSETDGGANFGKSSFGSNFDFAKYLSTLDEKEMLARCVCGICADVAIEPTITDCKHVFCRDCIQSECNKAAAQSDFTECPVCQYAFRSTNPFKELEARQDVVTPSTDDEESQTGSGRGRKGKKKLDGPWLNLPGEMLPSAKMIALKHRILEWQQEAPDDKIVVFTQFRLMARIIAKICEGEGWPCVLYTGDMNQQARYKVVQRFGAQDSEIKIMIAGLRCGGQGLNLTMANRVVSIDLWWNHSVELQAFGRVFRIGQHKETHLTRIVVRNTVDDRLLKMQDDKIRVVDGAMMDDGRKVKPLTVEELASLFGYLTKDEQGNMVLEPHQEDTASMNDPQ